MEGNTRLIEFNNYIDLAELFKRHNRGFNEYVTMQIGYDEKIYILFNEQIPERINGMFVPTESNSRYYVLELEVDWYEGSVINEKLYDLGNQKMNYSFVQPIEGGLLLVAARCSFNKGNPDKNATIVDFSGNIVDELCLGDGISQCLYHPEIGIVIGYFDEGVFGNYGWTEPLGTYGVRVWGRDGQDVWKADRPIFDCYAMNVSAAGDIWYYYYDEFKLIKANINKPSEVEFDPGTKGSYSLIISEDTVTIITDKGYDANEDYIAESVQGDKLSEPVPVSFAYKGEHCVLGLLASYGSKAAFVEGGTRLFVRKI